MWPFHNWKKTARDLDAKCEELKNKYPPRPDDLDTPMLELRTSAEADSDGMVKLEMDWNLTFIDKIRKMGFQTESEEQSIQMFLRLMFANTTMAEQDDIAEEIDETNISDVNNRFIKG